MAELTVENLHFTYKNKHILHGFDLQVHDGEVVGIVGPNGSGKTTLMRLISGVLRPIQGTIRVNGEDLSNLKPVNRAKLISVVSQNPVLPLNFKVVDLVLMGRNPHLGLLQWEGRRDSEISSWAMKMTGVWSLANRPLWALSGGERQRVLIAMALVQETPFLLLDEPTTSLDITHQTETMDLVRNMHRRQGYGMIVAMHDLTLAAQYCDRLVMLAEGQRYADGPPNSVLTTDNIAKVYGINSVILAHPQSGTPVVLPLSNQN